MQQERERTRARAVTHKHIQHATHTACACSATTCETRATRRMSSYFLPPHPSPHPHQMGGWSEAWKTVLFQGFCETTDQNFDHPPPPSTPTHFSKNSRFFSHTPPPHISSKKLPILPSTKLPPTTPSLGRLGWCCGVGGVG